MIQINLLPDVKREYLHAQQMKHLFVVGSVIATLVSVSVLALLFAYVQIVQPRHRVNLQKDVDTGIETLKNTPDAVKIVTVQGVLEQTPALQNKKLITSNLFTVLGEFTPKDVAYSEVKLDLATNVLSLSGQTTTLERANVLANNLKSAEFTYMQNETKQSMKPFTNVVFAGLGKGRSAQGGKDVSFQISFTFDPVLFSQTVKEGKISVNAGSEELILPSAKPFNETLPQGEPQ